jgi:MFS family permease
MSSTRGYAPLLRTSGALAFTGAALVGRLPIAMLGIGTVLLVEDRRSSYALAGLVSAAYAAGTALLGPALSRLVDRLGQRRVLPGALLLSAAGIVGLVTLAGTAAPAWTLLACALVMSACPSQLGSCVRARWSWALRERPAEVPRAYAWEAVVDEVVFVLGPLVVVLCAAADPAVGLLAALGLGSVGTLAFLALRASEPPVLPVVEGAGRSALASAGLRTLTVSMLCVGVLFGTVEVSMVAFAEQRGSASGGGLLLALVAGGSAAAGLLYGTLHWRASPRRRLLLGTLFLALGLVPLLFAPSVAWMAPAALLAGFAISPVLIVAFGLVEDLVPPAARTEGFSWLNSGLGIGVAGGFAVSGAVAEATGARAAFAIALGGALAAGAVALLARDTLLPRAQVAVGSWADEAS